MTSHADLSDSSRSSARRTIVWINLSAIVAIVAVDWLTPAGVVVGILLAVPVVLTSTFDDVRQIWTTVVVAFGGFLLAAGYGRGPIAPEAVWIPNRIIAVLAIVASAYLAFLLRRRRLESEAARDSAVSARDLNRLLMSLLAHDLRAPLTLAAQGFDYVTDSTRRGDEVDLELVADLRSRLHRSLQAVDVVLAVAREDLREEGGEGGREPQALVPLAEVGREIAAEINFFASEARHSGKRLVARVSELETGDPRWRVNGLVLRQTIAILVDNAIRHASPGRVEIEALRESSDLVVRVKDEGPGLSPPRKPASSGSGMGLELARSLVARVGGNIEIEADSPLGTVFALRLPMQPDSTR